MARNRDPFTQALSSLRERIQSGQLAGGAPVIVQDEARRLNLSTTPVREALARLSGEGLVERAAAGGYVTLRLDATAVRDRYAVQDQFLHFALELTADALGSVRPPAPAFDPGSPGPAVGRLFARIVRSTGNHVLWTGFDRTASQLEVLMRFEAELFEDLVLEASSLYATYADAHGSGFAEAVKRFHVRRMAASGALSALAHGAGLPTGAG